MANQPFAFFSSFFFWFIMFSSYVCLAAETNGEKTTRRGGEGFHSRRASNISSCLFFLSTPVVVMFGKSLRIPWNINSTWLKMCQRTLAAWVTRLLSWSLFMQIYARAEIFVLHLSRLVDIQHPDDMLQIARHQQNCIEEKFLFVSSWLQFVLKWSTRGGRKKHWSSFLRSLRPSNISQPRFFFLFVSFGAPFLPSFVQCTNLWAGKLKNIITFRFATKHAMHGAMWCTRRLGSMVHHDFDFLFGSTAERETKELKKFYELSMGSELHPQKSSPADREK